MENAGKGIGGKWSSLLLVAVLAIAAYVHFTVVTQSVVPIPMASDASAYFSYAYNLKYHGVYSDDQSWAGETSPAGIQADSLSTPGYPLFLLAIPGLDTSNAYLERVGRVQAVLGVFSVLVFFLLASRFLRPGWSHAATLLMGTSPHLANLETNLLSETLFLFFLLASALATVRAFERQRRLAFVLAGVSWGVCALVRPAVLGLPVLLLAACWLAPRLRAWRMHALWLCAAFVLVQSPWFVRNQVTALDPAQGNLLVWSVHHGSYPDLMYHGRPETLGWPFRADPNSLEAEHSWPNLLKDLEAKFRAEPMRMARWYLIGKAGTFLSWGHVQGVDVYIYEPTRTPWRERPGFALLRVIALLLHWPLMLAGVAAALLVWWRPGWLRLQGGPLFSARLVSAVVLYAIAFHMVVASYPRYGMPFWPFLQALALAWLAAPFTARARPQ